MGAEVEAAERAPKSWRHPLAFTTAFLTLLMIVLGATVTTIEAGDSDPTWSFFRPWEWFRPAEGGLWYELMHRRLGTIIGFFGIALVVSLWRSEPRRWARRLGYTTFGLIVVQGLIGGLRIHVVSSPGVRDFFVDTFGWDQHALRMAVAMVHAFNAQLVFCLLVVVTLVTSRGWIRGEAKRAVSAATSGTRAVCVLTCAAIFVQLLLGAFIRHGRVFWPSQSVPLHEAMTWIHMGFALVVVALLFLLNARTRAKHPAAFPIWHLAGLAKFLVLLQLFLGFGAWAVTLRGEIAMPGDVAMLVRTGHVANGAMIFAIVVTMTVRSFKLLVRPGSQPKPDAEPTIVQPPKDQREVPA